MKTAVVHDYFIQLGGAEKVAEEIYHLLPDPDLYATVALRNRMPASLGEVQVNTSWMQRLPRMKSWYRYYFLLYPLAVKSLKFSDYDLVISSSSGYVKGIAVGRNTVHVCYCHTPMRWAWSFDSYSERENFSGVSRLILGTAARVLRAWDKKAAQRPDYFIANSKVIAKRIKQAYGRDAEVIEPPIDVQRFKVLEEQDDYYIVLSRLVSYKRIDLAVRAFSELGKRLIVIGSGPALENLRSLAGPSVEFVGRLSDSEVESYVGRCRALIFPGEEDFGMTPLEVAAAGRPTIAYRAGGALETIIDGETGMFFEKQTVESLKDAIITFEALSWSSLKIRAQAERFDRKVFHQRMRAFLDRIGSPIS